MQKRPPMSKAGFVLALAAPALAGCAVPVATAVVSDPRSLAERGSGLLLLHTSLNDEGCSEVTARLATPAVSGRAIDIGRSVTLKQGAAAAPAVLPAGSYGIVRVACRNAEGERVFEAPVQERGNVLDGSGTVYAAALATFRIAPGEILDAGSLRLAPTRPGQDPGPFAVAVAPSPDSWLKSLATADPGLVSERIVRPLSPRS